MTKTGPVLIECNPRVGGGNVSDLHKQGTFQQLTNGKNSVFRFVYIQHMALT